MYFRVVGAWELELRKAAEAEVVMGEVGLRLLRIMFPRDMVRERVQACRGRKHCRRRGCRRRVVEKSEVGIRDGITVEL